MDLSIPERLMALRLLPRQGTYASMKILENLRLSLSFTEKETKEWKIRSDEVEDRTYWDFDGEVEIPIGEIATEIVVDSLKKHSKEETLPDMAISLYEKFIPTTE